MPLYQCSSPFVLMLPGAGRNPITYCIPAPTRLRIPMEDNAPRFRQQHLSLEIY
ncbi:uncharacterized protein K452DRAFT_283461 [Aplosporella prunicola CBS 121167]|uniref:Uncharacterized protein n=1 Tax=Aplosporella prunicola CBS 121167 TaxID=1176127 RepID=A0A6A6BU66_9PEZI|nr:uncharacterized protein K452DRAFT_283461 [Aplosporella prunicola CBS 121167]KAF2146181.1 hypothetical protein K452DRAFT_283461 [Aplosporella prunicola CBS 121167]